MPALDNITATADDIGPITMSIKDQAATALGWHWDRFPDGVTQGFGAAMQEYMAGKLTKDKLFEKSDKTVKDIVKKAITQKSQCPRGAEIFCMLMGKNGPLLPCLFNYMVNDF
jgi:hypothetical protein